MDKYFVLLTTIGAAKLANATSLGKTLEITHMAVGDSNGVMSTPSAIQSALIKECYRAQLNSLSQDEINKNQIIAEMIIPENVGGWYVREAGLFDADGDLIAIANTPESYKPQLQEGTGRTQTIRMILIVSNADSVSLKIDPAVVLATRQFVEKSISEHEKSRKHPEASITEKGLIQLSSAVTSDAEDKAATPKAVKKAYDLASAAKNITDKCLIKSENLSDVSDVNQVLKNLGLMSAAKRDVGAGINQIPDMSFFTSGLGTPGYQILPSGLVFQWGTAAVPTASSVTVVYPLALSAGFLQLVSPVDNGLANNYRVGVAASTLTSITIASTNSASATGVMWLAIGKINGVKNV